MRWNRIPGIYWLHRQFWNTHSATWDEATDTSEYRAGLERLVAAVAERSDDRAGRVLDLGCGTGNYSIALARDGWTVDGLDLAPKMLRRAARKAEEACPGQVELHRGNFNRRLPFGDGSFRHVLCIAALQCVGEASLFAEIHRVLHDGGWFYGVFRDDALDDRRPRRRGRSGPPSFGWRAMLALKSRVGRTRLITHWTDDSMRRTVTQAGLEVDGTELFYRGTRLILARRPAQT